MTEGVITAAVCLHYFFSSLVQTRAGKFSLFTCSAGLGSRLVSMTQSLSLLILFVYCQQIQRQHWKTLTWRLVYLLPLSLRAPSVIQKLLKIHQWDTLLFKVKCSSIKSPLDKTNNKSERFFHRFTTDIGWTVINKYQNKFWVNNNKSQDQQVPNQNQVPNPFQNVTSMRSVQSQDQQGQEQVPSQGQEVISEH